ncbi:MAG: alpha/beta hydrolase, partial [Candidatus Promineifilaceae bacterium]
PRPLLILHGGQDHRVPADHGQRLYAAAGKPKEYWFVPEAGHVNFEQIVPEEYEHRVVGFFDRYVLAGPSASTGPRSSTSRS